MMTSRWEKKSPGSKQLLKRGHFLPLITFMRSEAEAFSERGKINGTTNFHHHRDDPPRCRRIPDLCDDRHSIHPIDSWGTESDSAVSNSPRASHHPLGYQGAAAGGCARFALGSDDAAHRARSQDRTASDRGGRPLRTRWTALF